MNERFGELVLGPPRLQRPLPGGVLDVADIGRSLSDHCDERSEFVVEIDVATSDGNRFFRAKSGVCSGDGVRGLAVVAGIDGAHCEGDGFAGARIERPGVLEPMAIAATARRESLFYLGALFALLLAFPVVFFWLVAPANSVFLTTVLPDIPPNWADQRSNWEIGHTIRFGLQLVALALLVLPLTLGSRPTTVTSEPGPDNCQP